jgi:hypothetical protein
MILAEKHVHDTRAERFMANLNRVKTSHIRWKKESRAQQPFMAMFVRTEPSKGIASNTDRLKIDKQLSQLSVYAKT